MTNQVSQAAVERFRTSLLALTGAAPARLGVAVSGGPDSLALLLLAAATLPGQVEAATVDHGLRCGSAAEAEAVKTVCATRGIRHRTLRLDWPTPLSNNIQARAREGRYAELLVWALDVGATHLATGHHADDQAETLLLRLARGSGLPGLAGTRPARLQGGRGSATVRLVRPLLGWRRGELAEIVASAGLIPIDDPTNLDPRFDRTQARALLREMPWLDPLRVSASAQHLLEAEDALNWTMREFLSDRTVAPDNGDILLDPRDLPPEFQRRLLTNALRHFNGCADPPPGPKVMRALALLRAGRRCTLAGVQMTGGKHWHLTWAPPRRDTRSNDMPR